MRRIAYFWRTLLCAMRGHRPAHLPGGTKAALVLSGHRPIPAFVCLRCAGAFSRRSVD